MRSLLAMSASSDGYQFLTIFFVALIVCLGAIIITRMIIDGKVALAAKHAERRKAEIESAKIARDEMIVRNKYRKNADGSIEPTERKSP